jgi:hypothetical protein
MVRAQTFSQTKGIIIIRLLVEDEPEDERMITVKFLLVA